MKHFHIQKCAHFLFIASCSLMLLSCDDYHFEYPLPVDVENIYTFPKALIGNWIGDDKTTIVIKKASISMQAKEKKNVDKSPVIFNGLIDSAAAKKGFEGLRHIGYNHEKNRMDTIQDFIIKGHEVYKINTEGLSLGRKFKLIKDTLYTESIVTDSKLEFNLGEDCFLRKVSTNRYLLNLRKGNLLSNLNTGIWYYILLIEKKKDGTLQIGTPHSVPDSVKITRLQSDVYLNCRWFRSQVASAIQKGFFEQDIFFKEGDKRLDSLLNKKN